MATVVAARSPQRRIYSLFVSLVAVALIASCAAGNPSKESASGSRSNPGSASGIASPDASKSGPGSPGLESERPSFVTTIPLAAEPSPESVPADLTPSLSTARQDLPPIYHDGCHLGFTATTPMACAFGDTGSGTRVILIGDSSAAQWFPALQRLAIANHWRLESLTKSACTVADIAVWQATLKRPYTECSTWRSLILERIRAERPALVIVSTSHGYQLVVAGQSVPMSALRATYQAALTRTLVSLDAISQRVVLLGTTPDSSVDPPVCLAAHVAAANACTTPFDRAVDGPFRTLEIASGASAGVHWIDPIPWVCPADPCPAIIGGILVYRDPGHLTATFSASLDVTLGSALQAVP